MAPLAYFRLSRHRWVVTLAVFLVGWHFVAEQVVENRIFMVGPIDSARAVRESWQAGFLPRDLATSGRELLLGFFPSVALGIMLGTLLGVSDRMKRFIDPALNAWWATPLIALLPLFVVWFGAGETKTIVICAVLCFVTATINTDVGIRSTDPRLLEVARAFGASRMQLLYKVRLHAALPSILTGIRLSVGRGLIGVVIGEFFGATSGIGYRIFIASQTFNTGLLLGCAAITAVVGVAFVAVMEAIGRKAAPWRAAEESRTA